MNPDIKFGFAVGVLSGIILSAIAYEVATWLAG